MLTSLLILTPKVDKTETQPSLETSLVHPESIRKLVYDLKEIKLALFYRDLLVSAFLSYAAMYISFISPIYIVPFSIFISAIFQFRCLAFIHEIFHQQNQHRFRHVWHIVTGIPFLVPFALYYPIHFSHHSAKVFGTTQDGEYEHFKGNFHKGVLKLIAINFIAPIALILRFCILSPLAFFIPGFREKVLPKAIHLTLKMPYQVQPYKDPFKTENLIIEAFCCLYGWAFLSFSYLVSFKLIICWAAVLITISQLNTLRFICSTHLYDEQPQGRDFNGQLNDSINVGGTSFITELICPVGLRFHALHHIAPYLPYHALAIAHERIMKNLPPNSEYHQATVNNLLEGFQRVKKATFK